MKNKLRKMLSLVLAVVIAMSAISVNTAWRYKNEYETAQIRSYMLTGTVIHITSTAD